MVCGAPAAGQAQEQPQRRPPQADRDTVRFVRAVIRRPATFTFLFLLANVFLYVLMKLSGGATGNVLIAYGAKLNALIDEKGQWWRFVTPIFLHVDVPGLGPLHLLANMYGLFILGPYVEKLYGSAKFVVFWVLTGVAGVVASYLTVWPEMAERGALGRFLFKPYDVPSAGASGALFGLIGVLFVFGIKFRHELPEGLKRAFGTGMLPTIVINLFIGYVGSGFIDNAAHLGGLAAGAALAALVGYKRVGPRGPVAYTWHSLQVLCLLAVVAGFVMVALNFKAPPPRWGNRAGAQRQADGRDVEALVAFVNAMNEGQSAYAEFLRGDPGALASAVEGLGKAPAVNEQAAALRDELKSLLARASDVAKSGGAEGKDGRRRVQELNEEYGRWQERYAAWVRGEGRTLGIEFTEDKGK